MRKNPSLAVLAIAVAGALATSVGAATTVNLQSVEPAAFPDLSRLGINSLDNAGPGFKLKITYSLWTRKF
jgi:hypothetical protein